MNKEIAKILIDIQAVHLRPDDFFTWTSGVRSPIYCDNRQVISYPKYRKFITNAFVKCIKDKYSIAEVIAGTATAGIPWASWIADELNLPLVYIRSSAKGHGLKNAIEGKVETNQKVVVIEDLISTGKSSIQAAKEILEADLELLGVVSIFNYGFPFAKNAFDNQKIPFTSLCDLSTLLEYAKEENLLSQEQIDIITKWKNSTELN